MIGNDLFAELKSILKDYTTHLEVVHDKPTNYYLNT